MSSKQKIDGDYEEHAGFLIVSQYGQSSHRPYRACPRSPRAPWALGESTPEGALPGATSLLPEPDSPLAARPSHAAQSRGGGRIPGQQPAHPERAVVGCGCHRGHQS
jgi:hypothetical protein